MRFFHSIFQGMPILALSILFSGCGGGGGTSSGTQTPAPTFTLGSNAPPEIVVWKTQATTPSNPTVAVTVTPANGFSSSVTLSATGVPSGVTASFSPQPTTTSSQCVFNVTSGALSGTYPITIAGSGGGVNATAAGLNLTVKEAYHLALTDSAPSAKAGASAPTQINIAGSQYFLGSVQLSVTGLPAGVTTNWGLGGSNVLTSGYLTLNIASSVTPATYPLVVHGTSGVTPEQTIPLTLTVTSATGVTLTPQEKAGQIVKNALQMSQFALAPGVGGVPAKTSPTGEKVPLALDATSTCYTITSTTNTLLIDFSGCTDFSGSIGYAFSGGPSGYLMTATYNHFGYSNTFGGNLFAWLTNGVIASAGSVDPGGQSLTYTIVTQGPFSTQWTYGGQTYAYVFTMNETFNINLSTFRFTTSGTFTYTDGSGTWTITIPSGTPLVVDFQSGCAYPISGTMNISGPSGTFTATFGPTCGTVTINPGNFVFNL